MIDFAEFSTDREPTDAELRAFLRDSADRAKDDVVGKDPKDGSDIPFVSACAVASIDGIISFAEPGDEGPSGIGMAHTYPELSRIDLCVLRKSWALSDAILISGLVLRNEPNITFTINPDGEKQPLLIVVTGTGNLPYLSHPVFNQTQTQTQTQTRQRVVVAAPRHAVARMPAHVAREAIAVPCVDGDDDDSARGARIDLRFLLRALKRDFGVRRVDVAAGGATLTQLVKGRMLHEVTLTRTLHLAGTRNAQGVLRPLAFGDNLSFTSTTAPRMRLAALRACGAHMLIMRLRVEYSSRHGEDAHI